MTGKKLSSVFLNHAPRKESACKETYADDRLTTLEAQSVASQKAFSLEPVSTFVGKEKMTSDTGERIRF